MEKNKSQKSPRLHQEKVYRANAPATTAEGFYRVNYYYPFVDHVLSHLQNRFLEQLKGAMLAYYLMPKKLAKLTMEVEEAIKKEYMEDMPMPCSFGPEVLQWKQKFSTVTLDIDELDLVDII